jgi:hypothetical protein
METEIPRIDQLSALMLDEIGAGSGDAVVDGVSRDLAVRELHWEAGDDRKGWLLGVSRLWEGKVEQLPLAVFVGARVGTEDEISHAVLCAGAALCVLDSPQDSSSHGRRVEGNGLIQERDRTRVIDM